VTAAKKSISVMQNGKSAPYINMKSFYFKLAIVFVVSVQLICCADKFPSRYVLELPKTPQSWVSLLGEPYWLVEWIDPGGQKKSMNIIPYYSLEIELPVTWANPVTAWPYWPKHNLIPGLFKPAGTLFPFDAKDRRLSLSWEAGPDTIFYWELVLANLNKQNDSRMPANFDWPRFRELFKINVLNKAVSEDPWLINWRSVAERTASGNFDRRRLVSENIELKTIPVSGGPWYGTSPFAKPLVFAEGDTPVFPVLPGVNVWVSAEGILKVNGDTWVFIEW
jgi:hypothetical protein